MKSTIISILIIFIIFQTGVLTAQSIEWTRVYHDDYGRPLYTGGTSYSAPAFADIDGDGDYDYFQGCKNGTIWFFENVGTPDSAVWHFVTEKYNNIEFDYLEYSNVTFADIDADGDLDMFVGGGNNYNKWIHFYENIGDSTSASWIFITDQYMNISTSVVYGDYSHTQFADIDNDDDLDLFFVNQATRVSLYENIGSDTSANFMFITDNLLNYSGGNGKLLLEIEDIDNDNDFDLFMGSSFWRNEGIPDSAVWILESYNYFNIDVAFDYPIGLDLTDIDNDLDYDAYVGMENGTLYHFKNISSGNEPVWQFITNNPHTIDGGQDSFLSLCDIDGDGLLELFLANDDRSCYTPLYITFYENEGMTGQPLWKIDTTSFFNISYPDISSPEFGDIDHDGDFDMFLGQCSPDIKYHENTGDENNPQFDSVGTLIFTIPEPNNFIFRPALVDIDADGDLDMFISAMATIVPYFKLHFYRNDGTPTQSVWIHVFSQYFPGGVVDFMDEDEDGDYDMFIGTLGDSVLGDIFFFKNTGDSSNFNFVLETEHYANIRVELGMNIHFFDINVDNRTDLIIGENDGGMNIFINDGPNLIASEFDPQIDNFILHQNFPNPFNSSTTINFSIPKPGIVKMQIYNILGQRIKTMINTRLMTGEHKLVWDGTDEYGYQMSSGLYYCVVKSDNMQQQIKLLFLK